MCLLITGVATLIHLYSIGYMHGDPKFSVLYLNLFAFDADAGHRSNLLITFLGLGGRRRLLLHADLVLAPQRGQCGRR
ncbi:MAG: hypothetical protein R2704_12815 [Microthrixaceae bacterium]